MWVKKAYNESVYTITMLCFLHLGTIGPELTAYNVSIFITSDAGNTWREVLWLKETGATEAWHKIKTTDTLIFSSIGLWLNHLEEGANSEWMMHDKDWHYPWSCTTGSYYYFPIQLLRSCFIWWALLNVFLYIICCMCCVAVFHVLCNCVAWYSRIVV